MGEEEVEAEELTTRRSMGTSLAGGEGVVARIGEEIEVVVVVGDIMVGIEVVTMVGMRPGMVEMILRAH